MEELKEHREQLEKARRVLDEGLGRVALRGKLGGADFAPFLTSEYADALMELMGLVLEGNEVVNLTTITEKEEFVLLHLVDSLACTCLPEFTAAECIVDVGCGAGFPGLPLAMLFPGKRFLLTDSLRKRCEFVEFAAKELGLKNVDVLHKRAEIAGQDHTLREKFDLTLCRAVGKMGVVLEYCLPLARVSGGAVFYKTVPAAGEIEDSLLARELLGGSAEVRVETYPDLLPGRSHALYIVQKEKPTPIVYPRREGVPERVPL